ncbi:MAG: WYL domain-containing protein [Actinomycetota bacterium]|nr:WYL domain-containing protein [Actinomycetota bacterium]
MRRIERLINLIAALLETPRPMTAQEIREEISGYDQPNDEAFRRAFERDKEALRAMGIPLELRKSDPFADVGDAYIIPKDKYYLPDLDLEPDELAALGVAAQAVLGAGDQAASGLLKLTADTSLPSLGGPRILWGADVAAEQPLLGPLYAALLDRQAVRFHYGTGDAAGSRTVEGYGLVHRRGNWYLVGNDTGDGVIKSFRVSRMSGVQRITSSYEVPEGFAAGDRLDREAWEWGPEPTSDATILFSDSVRWWAEQNLPAAKTRPRSDGLEVDVPFANVDALVSWLIGFGDRVTLIEPGSARHKLLSSLEPYLDGAR